MYTTVEDHKGLRWLGDEGWLEYSTANQAHN